MKNGGHVTEHDLAVGEVLASLVIELAHTRQREIRVGVYVVHREGKVRAAKARPLADWLRDALAGERGAQSTRSRGKAHRERGLNNDGECDP